MPRYAKIDPLRFGLAAGILAAICVAVSTILAMNGYFLQYNSLILSIYAPFGYTFSGVGIILGAIYAFIDAFIVTALFAWIYDLMI